MQQHLWWWSLKTSVCVEAYCPASTHADWASLARVAMSASNLQPPRRRRRDGVPAKVSLTCFCWIFLASLLTWVFLQGNDKRGEPHNYCWTYLLKHIEQIHRIQIKRWQFTSSSSLLSSTEVRTLALHAALWQTRLLEVNRLHEGFTCWASAATKVPFLICWGLFLLFTKLLKPY